MWKFYYLSQLVGWQNRLRVVLNWVLALLFPRSSALSYECSEECVQELCPDVGLMDAGIEIEEPCESEPVEIRSV